MKNTQFERGEYYKAGDLHLELRDVGVEEEEKEEEARLIHGHTRNSAGGLLYPPECSGRQAAASLPTCLCDIDFADLGGCRGEPTPVYRNRQFSTPLVIIFSILVFSFMYSVGGCYLHSGKVSRSEFFKLGSKLLF